MAKAKKMTKKMTKKAVKDGDKGAVPNEHKVPEDILLRNLILSQNRHWKIADGTKAEPGQWYKSKRGNLVMLNEIQENGGVVVISHVTGNKIVVPPEQVIYFTPSEDPGTPCGTIVVTGEDSDPAAASTGGAHSELYSKYPHIIPGSIYKVQNVGGTDAIPTWERKRKGKKISIKGQVRCKIKCQEPGCNKERDIKVQDAFQVKKCDDCRGKKKKKALRKFLNKKKDSTK